MPRSYSYDHFQVQKKDTHLVHRDEKAKYTETTPHSGDAKIHYGHAHAQTEELLAARQMNAQLEELAGLRVEEATQRPVEKPQKTAKRQELRAELPEAPELPRSAPIGALPVTDEPVTAMPDSLMSELLEQTSGKLRGVRMAATELFHATLNLARLPADLALIAARHLRPLRA